jgi:hypothetical protein
MPLSVTMLWHYAECRILFILHERSERSEHSEVKGIKNRHKKISPAHICMGVHVSVCVSVCLSGLKSWITFDGMKGFWYNFKDQSNSSQVIFGKENLISWPKGYALGQKQPVPRKSISSLSFCSTGMWHTFWETLWPGLKSLGSGILNFGVGPKILDPEWAGTWPKNIFLEFGIFIKNRPPYYWILRTFYLMRLIDQGHKLWAGSSDSSAQKLLARSWTGPDNFIKILSFHQKLFNFLIWTDTQTDTRTPIHKRVGKIF